MELSLHVWRMEWTFECLLYMHCVVSVSHDKQRYCVTHSQSVKSESLVLFFSQEGIAGEMVGLHPHIGWLLTLL